MQLNNRKKPISEINVTPFVDVMLVLLIIFMVTAPMMAEGLDVNLPATESSTDLPMEKETLILSVTKAGDIYLGNTRVELDTLDKVLAATVTDQKKMLFLQADKEVPYGLVVEVMGKAKAGGIENLGVVSERPAKGR